MNIENRKRIDWFGQPLLESAVTMAEGNPGAATVISRLIPSERGVLGLMSCYYENIRGHQLWIAYKDLCNQDFNEFMEQITNNCRDLANKVRAIENGELINEEWFSP